MADKVSRLEKVTRGMELLTWRHSTDLWSRHESRLRERAFSTRSRRRAKQLRDLLLDNRVMRLSRRIAYWAKRVPPLLRVVSLMLVALPLAAAFSDGTAATFMFNWYMVIGAGLAVFGLGVFLSRLLRVLAWLAICVGRLSLWLTDQWARLKRRQPDESDEVLFTSTGLAFGPRAYLWSTLRHARLCAPNETHPAYLDLAFSRLFKVHVPVPVRCNRDGAELCQMLQEKIAGREARELPAALHRE